MDGSIVLGGSQRKRLLRTYRKESDPQVRVRAQVILLLADGHAWALIAAVLFCSTATIARWKRRRRARRRRGIAAAGARAASDVLARPGGGRGAMGQDADAARLRVLPQPVVLRHVAGGAVGRPPPEGQPGDGP